MLRATTYSIGRNFVFNLNKHLFNISKYSNEVSSGKKLQKPSDDPTGSTLVLKLQSTIQLSEQYVRNIEDGELRLKMAEDVLNDVQNLTSRAKDIAIMGSNTTMNESDRKIMAEEVNQLVEHLSSIINRKSVDNYLFGGTQADQSPFVENRNSDGEIESISIQGDISGKLIRTVGEGANVQVNMNGNGLFYGDDNLFDSLVNLREALQGNQRESISDELGNLNDLFDNAVGLMSEVGSKTKYLLDRKDEMNMESVNLQERISQISDTDYAESLIQLQEEQILYEAALAVGSKILDSTLMNFLR
jgi:flagellar hook-associated protein 3 FlgL